MSKKNDIQYRPYDLSDFRTKIKLFGRKYCQMNPDKNKRLEHYVSLVLDKIDDLYTPEEFLEKCAWVDTVDGEIVYTPCGEPEDNKDAKDKDQLYFDF